MDDSSEVCMVFGGLDTDVDKLGRSGQVITLKHVQALMYQVRALFGVRTCLQRLGLIRLCSQLSC